MLPRFYGLSRQDAAEVAAALAPHPAPPARTVITRTAPPVTARTATLALEPTAGTGAAAGAESPVATPSRPEKPARGSTVEPPGQRPCAAARRAEIVPLAADRSRLHVTVSKDFLRKLEAATAALSNARPGATPEQILEADLDLLLARAAKRRGEVERPQRKQRPSKPDRIPAAVRREVWAGRRKVPVDDGVRRHLRLHPTPAARPHPSARARWDLHRRQPENPLPGP